jgi:hypothetical protein
VICFTKVRFLQTYSLLRWSQRPSLFQPFPSLKWSPRPSELFSSIKWVTQTTQGPPQLGVSCFYYKGVENKKWGRRKAIQEQELKEHEQKTLSSHYLLGVEMGLGEALILFDLYLVLIALALVLNLKYENLNALKCGGWGVFTAPTTKMVVGRGCCRWAHRTVRCATGHCPVRQPRHPTVRVRPLEP